jgi:hypothetical protein
MKGVAYIPAFQVAEFSGHDLKQPTSTIDGTNHETPIHSFFYSQTITKLESSEQR